MGRATKAAADERLLAAYHQAAHAVMAVVHGRGVSAIVLGEERLEPARKPKGGGRPPRGRVDAAVLCALAGLAAEALLTGGAEKSVVAESAADVRDARALARMRCMTDEEASAYLCWMSIRARTLLALDRVWPAVKALAEALFVEERLSAAGVRAIVGDAIVDASRGKRAPPKRAGRRAAAR